MNTTHRPEARRHHYVPQFLIKGFATRGKRKVFRTRVLDKRTGSTFIAPVRDVMLEGDFNAIEVSPGERVSLEEHIGKFEDLTAPLIERVLQARTIEVLTQVERFELVRFVALQFIRGTAHRAMYGDIARYFAAEIEGRGFPVPGGMMPTPDEVKAHGLLSIAKDLNNYAAHMATKEMLLLRAAPGCEFILGDNPVSLSNQEPAGFYGNLGIASKGIQIYLPLSVEFTLALWCPTIGAQIRETQRTVRTKIGTLKARSLLGAAGRPLPDDRLRELDQALQDLANIDRTFNHGDPMVCENQNVIYLNSLQVAHAERFVVSRSGDFELVHEMIGTDQRYQSGRRMNVG